jgi:hypothetical protein
VERIQTPVGESGTQTDKSKRQELSGKMKIFTDLAPGFPRAMKHTAGGGLSCGQRTRGPRIRGKTLVVEVSEKEALTRTKPYKEIVNLIRVGTASDFKKVDEQP